MSQTDVCRPGLQRREFMRAGVTSGLALALPDPRSDAAPPASRPRVCVYTEHFQSLAIPEVCRIFREMGVDGLDLTVRPGGHVEPRDAKVQLPKAARAAEEHGLAIMMLTTGITRADHSAAEILATCQQLGIDRIKLGYYRIGQPAMLARQLDDIRRQLDDLVKVAVQYDVRPCIHIHSGPTVPNSGFMLYQLLRDMPPDRIGAYLDSYHMMITGGAGGWRQAIDLLAPWISLVALKNFQWERLDRDETGQQKWRTRYCRLQDGIAPVPDFVRAVHQTGYRGFYTLHTEYRMPVKECIRLTTEDFAFLRKAFSQL